MILKEEYEEAHAIEGCGVAIVVLVFFFSLIAIGNGWYLAIQGALAVAVFVGAAMIWNARKTIRAWRDERRQEAIEERTQKATDELRRDGALRSCKWPCAPVRCRRR